MTTRNILRTSDSPRSSAASLNEFSYCTANGEEKQRYRPDKMQPMLTPFNLELIQSALGTRDGWTELCAILLCFAVGWWADRRIRLASARESRVIRFGAGSFNRLIFPLTTLALLL